MKRTVLAAVVVLALGTLAWGNPPEAVQVDLKELLNARVVSTGTDGKVNNLKVDMDGGDRHGDDLPPARGDCDGMMLIPLAEIQVDKFRCLTGSR